MGGRKMVFSSVKCPYCGSDNVKKFGTSSNNKQRYLCCNEQCSHKTFIESYTYNACNPYIRSRIFFSIINGSGTRATARTLEIAKGTVTAALLNIEEALWHVNYDYIEKHKDTSIKVDIVLVDEAEMDGMWSFVHDKSQQYWLWWAIEHNTGKPLAFYFGTREHKNLDELLELLKLFDIKVVYTDDNDAYKLRITESEGVTGKRNMQKIERKHLSLRTWCSRLVRKGIRFSKSARMHKIVLALVSNFWFFS
jgi:IS1 family transposase/transposase-like protein